MCQRWVARPCRRRHPCCQPPHRASHVLPHLGGRHSSTRDHQRHPTTSKDNPVKRRHQPKLITGDAHLRARRCLPSEQPKLTSPPSVPPLLRLHHDHPSQRWGQPPTTCTIWIYIWKPTRSSQAPRRTHPPSHQASGQQGIGALHPPALLPWAVEPGPRHVMARVAGPHQPRTGKKSQRPRRRRRWLGFTRPRR